MAELMIIFAFIYNNLEKEGIVMKRMMKSKILATALCATVMAGIYASPVMANYLYMDKGAGYITGKDLSGYDKITNLELDGKLTVGEIEVGKLNGVELGDLVDKSALEQEKDDRIAGDKALEDKINGESLIRQDADKELADKIGQEEMDRKNEDAAIRGEIGQEVADRVAADKVLDNKIDTETADRKAEDQRIETKFDGEVARLDGEVNRLDNRIDKVEDRVDKVGAMAAAIANLRTMGYDPAAPTEIAVGLGQYRDETGLALGMFHYPNRDFMLSLSVSTSGDEVMGGIGATWKFGRKTPEQMLAAEKEKAAKAKLAKAEAMKKAAAEAKVAAQQAKHAKMAAEKAAK